MLMSDGLLLPRDKELNPPGFEASTLPLGNCPPSVIDIINSTACSASVTGLTHIEPSGEGVNLPPGLHFAA